MERSIQEINEEMKSALFGESRSSKRRKKSRVSGRHNASVGRNSADSRSSSRRSLSSSTSSRSLSRSKERRSRSNDYGDGYESAEEDSDDRDDEYEAPFSSQGWNWGKDAKSMERDRELRKIWESTMGDFSHYYPLPSAGGVRIESGPQHEILTNALNMCVSGMTISRNPGTDPSAISTRQIRAALRGIVRAIYILDNPQEEWACLFGDAHTSNSVSVGATGIDIGTPKDDEAATRGMCKTCEVQTAALMVFLGKLYADIETCSRLPPDDALRDLLSDVSNALADFFARHLSYLSATNYAGGLSPAQILRSSWSAMQSDALLSSESLQCAEWTKESACRFLDVQLFLLSTFATSCRKLPEISATALAYVARNSLSVTDKLISEYGLNDLVLAVNMILDRWVGLPDWHVELAAYIDHLFVLVAHFIHFDFHEPERYDCPDYLIRIAGAPISVSAAAKAAPPSLASSIKSRSALEPAVAASPLKLQSPAIQAEARSGAVVVDAKSTLMGSSIKAREMKAPETAATQSAPKTISSAATKKAAPPATKPELNARFMEDMTWCFFTLQERVRYAQWFKAASRDRRDAIAENHVRVWLQALANLEQRDDIATLMRAPINFALVRPHEYYLYSRDKPGSDLDLNSVLKYFRTKEGFRCLQENYALKPGEALRAGVFEGNVQDMVHIFFFTRFVNEYLGCDQFPGIFIVPMDQLRAKFSAKVSENSYPIFVDTFNRYSLVHKSERYGNCFAEALVAWIRIMKEECPPHPAFTYTMLAELERKILSPPPPPPPIVEPSDPDNFASMAESGPPATEEMREK